MSRFWSAIVHSLTPYVPGEQPKVANLVKLNTNENPYGPSPHVIAALRAEAADTLRLYPDPNADRLKEAVAAKFRVTPAHVFVANGSDELLAHAFQALLKHPLPLLVRISPTVSTRSTAACTGGSRDRAAYRDFRDPPGGYERPNGGVIFPNPNAPTGRGLLWRPSKGFWSEIPSRCWWWMKPMWISAGNPRCPCTSLPQPAGCSDPL